NLSRAMYLSPLVTVTRHRNAEDLVAQRIDRGNAPYSDVALPGHEPRFESVTRCRMSTPRARVSFHASAGCSSEAVSEQSGRGPRRRGWSVGWTHHPDGVEQAEQAGEDGHEQRGLQRDRPGVCVDADDLVADLGWLIGEQCLELGIAHDFGVLL